MTDIRNSKLNIRTSQELTHLLKLNDIAITQMRTLLSANNVKRLK